MAETFRNHVCWNDEAVLAATPRDAAALRPAQFRAVHHPLRLRRRPLGSRSGGTWTTEEQLAKALAGRLRDDGFLLVPIVGGAGTGKSHLVRWVHDTTSNTDGWEVRYLAKNRTSIRRVIEIIIDGREGDAFQRAREALERAPAQHERADTLAERLLDELAIIVSEPIDHAEGVEAQQRLLLDRLAKELPDVLRDPVVRRRFMAPGAVVPRLVQLAREGRRDGDGLDDDAIKITEDDLPLSFEELKNANKGARELLGKMAGVTSYRVGAVELINSALPSAVKRIFVSEQVDLIEVLRDLRRALQQESRELVLFIEDLTVLHGVEQEFLDALVEPAFSPGDEAKGRLCNLRVLFAVTEHHFDGLDTVRQRLEDAYWLDSPYGDDAMSLDEVTSFLGRYLNVARLNADLPDGPVPNACDACRHQETCHLTFGVSAEGYGRYPFDGSAIERLVAATAPERFDPREIVRSLVNRFLLHARSEVSEGVFPSAQLMEPFDRATPALDPLIVTRLTVDRPGDHEAVANLARYWADPVPLVADEILAAFGHQALDRSGLSGGSAVVRPGSRKGPMASPPITLGGGPEHRLSSANRAAYAALGEWAGGKTELGAAPTRAIRSLVAKVVLENLVDGATPLDLSAASDRERFTLKHVYVANSMTVHDREGTAIQLEPSAEVASALQGLLLLDERIDDTRTDDLRPYAAWAVERWTSDAAQYLAAHRDDPAVVAAIHAMTLCAALSGEVEVGDDAGKVLARLFHAPPTPPPEGSARRAARTTKWITLLEDAGARFPELDKRIRLTFGESRGSRGQVRAVRAEALLTHISTFSEAQQFSSDDATVDRLLRQVEPAIAAEWAALRRQVDAAAPHVDPDRPWSDQAAVVRELLVAASAAGKLPDAEALSDLDAARDRTSDRAQASLVKARYALAREMPVAARLALLTSDVPDDVAALAEFVTRASTALDALEDELRFDVSPTQEVGDLASVVRLVLEGTTSFLSAVEELTS